MGVGPLIFHGFDPSKDIGRRVNFLLSILVIVVCAEVL